MQSGVIIALIGVFASVAGYLMWHTHKFLNPPMPWDWAARCCSCGYGEYRDPSTFAKKDELKTAPYICPRCGGRYWNSVVGRLLRNGTWEWREEE